jgi:ABC-type uncharacterized transport system permease subunit
MNDLWKQPETWTQAVAFYSGFVIFWLLIPLWMILAKFYWKENTEFAIINIQALFYNPWLLYK